MNGTFYDISGNMVVNGIIKEAEHLDHCKTSSEQREFIKIMCCVGLKGYLE
tara:strand:- start:3921 stop:4073 length:153 start_codon:yes stop_codon:yes gene_type:complete